MYLKKKKKLVQSLLKIASEKYSKLICFKIQYNSSQSNQTQRVCLGAVSLGQRIDVGLKHLLFK